MAKPKTFPTEFESKRPVSFYPTQPDEVIGDILEIGPGNGELLLWHAENEPDKICIGIEISPRRIGKMIRRIERYHLSNVILIRGNARVLIPRFLQRPCFERIYVLFPDPWPKPRHSFQRLLSVETLSNLAASLKLGGEIILASDEKPYVDWVVENAAQVQVLRLDGSPYYTGPQLVPTGEGTWFERLWRQKGKEIYYVRMVRKS